MKYLGLGKRLQKLREARSLSLSELAAQSGVDDSELKAFEADKELPRIGQLIKLAKVLKVNVADIFRDRPSKSSYELIRKAERQKVQPLLEPQSDKVRDYLYEPLTLPGEDKHIDAYMIEIPPHQSRRPHPDLTHPGEEFVYLLEGRLKAIVDDEEFEIEEGDSLFLRSVYPHSFYNPFEKTARALSLIYPF